MARPDRYVLTEQLEAAISTVDIDEDDHPVADLTAAIMAAWLSAALDGPSMPGVHVTHDYDIVATAHVPGSAFTVAVATEQYGWDELTGRDDERRTHADLATAMRTLVAKLNAALNALDVFAQARREEVEFLRIAAGFYDPTAVNEMTFTPLAARICLVGDALLALLSAVEAGVDDDQSNTDDTEWVGLNLSPEQVEAYLASLEEGSEEDETLGRHQRTVAGQLSITQEFLEDFAVNLDHDPRVVLSAVGHLLDVATTLDAVAFERVTAETVTLLYDKVWNARSFRVASHVRVESVGVTLVSDRLPTTILSASSAPSASLQLLHGVEVAVAALDSAVADLNDHLTQQFVMEDLDARDGASAV